MPPTAHTDLNCEPVRPDAPVTRPARVRIIAALVCASGGLLLALAAALPPDHRRLGTHEALDLPPCGFLVSTGLPCPTCGMTSAFSLLIHGRPLAALRAQPAGAALALLTGLAVAVALWTVVRGRVPAIRWELLARGPGLVAIGLILFGGWAWKIADVLLHGPPRP